MQILFSWYLQTTLDPAARPAEDGGARRRPRRRRSSRGGRRGSSTCFTRASTRPRRPSWEWTSSPGSITTPSSPVRSLRCPITGGEEWTTCKQNSNKTNSRYEEDSNGNSTIFLNAGKKPADCKMVAKALFSFQAQNSRELSFRKGDVIYIKKQVDNNWYEGERNASVGIFPVTYVEILPNTPEVSNKASL